MRRINHNQGFTLIELCIYICIFAIFSTVTYSVLTTTHRTYAYNSRTVDLRQNLRATVDFLAGTIMTVGTSGFNMDTLTIGTAVTGFETAARNGFTYSSDPDMDNVITMTYIGLDAADDSDGDGLVDNATGTAALIREINSNGTLQTIVEDIQAVQFAYAVDTDGDGVADFIDADADNQMDSTEVIWAYDSTGNNFLDTNINGMPLTTSVYVDKIIMVRLWVLGRTPTTLKIPIDTRTYTMGPLVVTGGDDRFKRFLLATTVKRRN